MEKTYGKWKPWFDARFKKEHSASHLTWNNVNKFYCMTGGLLDSRVFTEDELEVMGCRLLDPWTGLTAAGVKLQTWYELLDKIRGVCVAPDGHLKICPDDPTAHGMCRLLLLRQDSLLLLFTILILHETAYKGIVNFVYNCSGHGKIGKAQTKQRAECLKKQGFDMTCTTDRFLRNGIAHSSFRIDNDGGVLVADVSDKPPSMNYDPKSTSPPPGTKYYTYQDLIKGFENRQSLLADAMAGVAYWFHVNHGMHKMFDDRFFGSAENDTLRDNALAEMEKCRSIRERKNILVKFEQQLPQR